VLRTLALRVRTVRKARGLTQPELAARSGISTNTLVAMEKGTASVQIGFWLQVLWALDLLDGFIDAVSHLGKTPADVDALEADLPRRVRNRSIR
jgi:transcriptional regulator with XRE-family HTH domain